MPSGIQQHGQEYDKKYNVVLPFTQIMDDKPTADAVVVAKTARTDVRPNDRDSSVVKTFDGTAITAVLASTTMSYPSTANIPLPDVLTAITAVWEKSGSDGSHDETGSGASVGSYASLSLSLTGRAQSSAVVMPDIQPEITQVWSSALPVMHYFFFLPIPVGATDILTKLTALAGATVNAWPIFKPKSHTITLKGQRVSVGADASASCAVSLNADNASVTQGAGTGSLQDIGASIKSVRLPPMIHGAITISGATDTKTATASATADITAGTNFPGGSSSKGAAAIASGSIVPSSLSATSPAALPTSGLYLHNSTVEFYGYGFVIVFAEVFDFASIA